MRLKKIFGILGIILMLADLLLFSFRIISPTVFWITAALLAAFAWWGLPKIP